MDMTIPPDDIEEVEDADDFEDFDDADDNKGIMNKLENRLFFGDPEDVEENLPVVGKIDAEKIIAFITVRDKLGGLL